MEKSLFSYTLNLIYNDEEVIGATDILPCTKKYIYKFLNSEITESNLLSEVKDDFIKGKLNYKSCNAIYLVSAIIKPGYRRKGLALASFIDSIKKVGIKKPFLFTWVYTKEGKALAKELANILGLELFLRDK